MTWPWLHNPEEAGLRLELGSLPRGPAWPCSARPTPCPAHLVQVSGQHLGQDLLRAPAELRGLQHHAVPCRARQGGAGQGELWERGGPSHLHSVLTPAGQVPASLFSQVKICLREVTDRPRAPPPRDGGPGMVDQGWWARRGNQLFLATRHQLPAHWLCGPPGGPRAGTAGSGRVGTALTCSEGAH